MANANCKPWLWLLQIKMNYWPELKIFTELCLLAMLDASGSHAGYRMELVKLQHYGPSYQSEPKPQVTSYQHKPQPPAKLAANQPASLLSAPESTSHQTVGLPSSPGSARYQPTSLPSAPAFVSASQQPASLLSDPEATSHQTAGLPSSAAPVSASQLGVSMA